MGFLTQLKKIKRKEREIRILVLGLDNAGKTTIVKCINGGDVNEVSPTLGFNISTLVHNRFTLNIWDIGGQKSIRSYWRNYFEQTEALVWVVDSIDIERLQDCKLKLHDLLKEERLAGASLLIFANKQDVNGALDQNQISQELQLQSIKSHRWNIFCCSAKTSAKEIIAGMDWVVEDVGKIMVE